MEGRCPRCEGSIRSRTPVGSLTRLTCANGHNTYATATELRSAERTVPVNAKVNVEKLVAKRRCECGALFAGRAARCPDCRTAAHREKQRLAYYKNNRNARPRVCAFCAKRIEGRHGNSRFHAECYKEHYKAKRRIPHGARKEVA